MPGGDITHPVPDLTGYITEGQIVLSPALHAAGVYPPVDVLGSLSRLMRKGAGPGRTREDHLDLAAQTLASLSRARQVRELAELMGSEALSMTDQAYLAFADAVDRRLLDQRGDQARSLGETLDRMWDALSALPSRELTMMPAGLVADHARRTVDHGPASGPPAGLRHGGG
jgi:V/A-type H+-transporting ATPase subunit B